MCGIFGYIGDRDAVPIVLEGLKRLEYRGYDSAGVAALVDGEVQLVKREGKIAALEEEMKRHPLSSPVAIAHTRWATHGKPSHKNAHPHTDPKKTLALVHNGIIENYEVLKEELIREGSVFASDTDTEVIAHLIAKQYRGDIVKAVYEVTALLEGSYAIALVHKDHPEEMVAVAHESPLVIGIGEEEAFLSSDSQAFAFFTNEVIYLSNNEIAVIRKGSQQVFNAPKSPVEKKTRQIEYAAGMDTAKGGFSHFTLKEIFQQPLSIRHALQQRLIPEYGTAHFSELRIDANTLLNAKRILIVACGTSYHAGLIASYFFEEWTRIPTQVEIASEFRYKHAVVPRNTLVIAISQSGETADTLAAVRELKAKKATLLALCNVAHSTLARESDSCLLLHAGPEIGVASTKAFSNQLAVLFLLGLMLGRMRHVRKEEGQEFMQHLIALPDLVHKVLALAPSIQQLAKKTVHYRNYFFIGRSYMYPVSLEGALKLKEISYLNATGYPAGEMKHGPIALIDPSCLTVALCTHEALFEKMYSNIMEIKARSGPIVSVVFEGERRLEDVTPYSIAIPRTKDELATILASIVLQLYAFYAALETGADIDQPRNLAKSVTVE